jgi:hypothetical protein
MIIHHSAVEFHGIRTLFRGGLSLIYIIEMPPRKTPRNGGCRRTSSDVTRDACRFATKPIPNSAKLQHESCAKECSSGICGKVMLGYRFTYSGDYREHHRYPKQQVPNCHPAGRSRSAILVGWGRTSRVVQVRSCRDYSEAEEIRETHAWLAQRGVARSRGISPFGA